MSPWRTSISRELFFLKTLSNTNRVALNGSITPLLFCLLTNFLRASPKKLLLNFSMRSRRKEICLLLVVLCHSGLTRSLKSCSNNMTQIINLPLLIKCSLLLKNFLSKNTSLNPRQLNLRRVSKIRKCRLSIKNYLR
jgi:hypothetical protein